MILAALIAHVMKPKCNPLTSGNTQGAEMVTAIRTLTIQDSVGIHARPASDFSQASIRSGCEVVISKGDGNPVNANSILSIIGLGITRGDTITIRVEGERAEEVADDLISILAES